MLCRRLSAVGRNQSLMRPLRIHSPTHPVPTQHLRSLTEAWFTSRQLSVSQDTAVALRNIVSATETGERTQSTLRVM